MAFETQPTVAGQDQELVLICELVNRHVGKGGDNLVFGGQFCALFEFKVADGARQGQVAIDAAKVNKSTGSRNAVSLICRWRKKRTRGQRLVSKGGELRFRIPPGQNILSS